MRSKTPGPNKRLPPKETKNDHVTAAILIAARFPVIYSLVFYKQLEPQGNL